MANLLEIAQEVYDEVFPNPSPQNAVKFDHVLVVAKSRYAYELWLKSKNDAREDGGWEVPSALWREAEIEVSNNKADISHLKIFRSYDGDAWLGSVGDGCDCPYVRVSMNLYGVIGCDKEYLGNSLPYTVIGNSIKFHNGAHSKTVPIVYASSGEDMDDNVEIDDAMSALVSDYLWKRFANKLPVDRTNNSNENK